MKNPAENKQLTKGEKTYNYFLLKKAIGARLIRLKSKNAVYFCGLHKNIFTAKNPDIVEIIKGEHENYFKDMAKCFNSHFCPFCRGKVIRNKFENLQPFFTGDFCHVIVTIQHNRKSELKGLIDTMRHAVNFSNTHKSMRRSVYNYVQVLEVTYNEKNGLHPHLHFLINYDTDKTVFQWINLINRYYIEKAPDKLVNENTFRIDFYTGDQKNSYYHNEKPYFIETATCTDKAVKLKYVLMDVLQVGNKDNSVFNALQNMPDVDFLNYFNGIFRRKLVQTRKIKIIESEKQSIETESKKNDFEGLLIGFIVSENFCRLNYSNRVLLLKVITENNAREIIEKVKTVQQSDNIELFNKNFTKYLNSFNNLNF